MKRTLGLMLSAIVGLAGAASASAVDTVKIGLLAPMTGSWASEGQEMKRNVELLA